MKKHFFNALFFCITAWHHGSAQNIGMGTNTPLNAKLEIVSPNTQLMASGGPNQTGISLSTPLNYSSALGFNLYFSNGFRLMNAGYGMAMQFSHTTGATYFLTTQDKGVAGGTAFLNPASIVLDSGSNVGIGTYPTYPLDVNGRMLLRNNGATAGIWFNNASNSATTSFIGNYNDTIAGIYTSTGGSWQLFFDHKNARLGIDLANPKVPVSFPAVLGKKISLYPGGNGDAGIGMWSNELRIHGDNAGADITFGYDTYNAAFQEKMRVKGNGAVCIGTTQVANGYLLNVGGKIIAEEVRVQVKSSWPDYVFDNRYLLRTLPELEKFITANHHLPNIPAADEVEKSGIAIGEMQQKMMEKIEELNLYVIDLQKQITQLKNQANDQ